MGLRGPKQQAGLLYHKSTGRYYRRIDGKVKYFGNSEEVAYRKWHKYEAALDQVPGAVHQLIGLLSAPVTILPQKVTREQVIDLRAILQELEDADKRMSDQLSALDTELSSPDHDLASCKQRYVAILNEEQRSNNNAISDLKERLLAKWQPPGESPIETTDPTCQQIVDIYLKYLETHKSDASDARNRLTNYWLKFIGPDTPITALTRDRFVAFRDLIYQQNDTYKAWEEKQPRPISVASKQEAPGMATSSLNKHFALVKGAFNRARDEAGITAPFVADYLALLKKRKASKQEVAIFTPKQIAKIIKAFDLKWELITTLALNGALGNRDISTLRWHHIRDKQVLDYRRSKQDGLRRIPLWTRTRKLIKAWDKICDSHEYVFTTSHGNPFQHVQKNGKRKDQLSIQFTKRLRDLGITNTFATVRKSTSTVAKMTGADNDTVKMILGDASDEIWQHYVMDMPVVPDNVKTAIKAVEKHYFGGKR